jgi:hypothetical protein
MSAGNEATGPLHSSPGTAAADFAVVCIKHSGERHVFGRYANRSRADAVATRLREFGCPAEAVAAS